MFVRLNERAFAQISQAGLEIVGHAVGGASVDFAGVEGLENEKKVELEGGAVFGKDEGDGIVEMVGIGRGRGFGESVFNAAMMASVKGLADGGRFAGFAFMKNVSTELDHVLPPPRGCFAW